MAPPSDESYPKQLFTALLKEPETIVRARRYEKRHLRIHVTWQGAGVAQAWRGGCLSGCPCGACCGPVGRADASGRIDIETFHPEQYDVIYFIDQDGKSRLWELDPSELPSSEDDVIDVDLTDVSPSQPPHSWSE